jgi:histidinol dehydrogenase
MPSTLLRIYTDWQQALRSGLRCNNLLNPQDLPERTRIGIRRVFGRDLQPDEAVSEILKDVQQRGDDALLEWTERIEGVTLSAIKVPPQDISDAWANLPADLRQALETAAERVRAFHTHQSLQSWSTTELGGTIGQRVAPLRRVGVYVPGGTAPLPSSLLMTVIPARVAGVSQVLVCTPPSPGNGTVPSAILAAAHIAGADHVFRIGGAQAIAAMAFGTQTIPKVDKIVGAGGLFVTTAKRLLYGQVGLDGLAGPTETLIIADDTANPCWVAADLLAQAEHDILATAILITPSQSLADAVLAQLEIQLSPLSRAQTARTSLSRQGAIVLTPGLAEAIELANAFAPEHLCLAIHQPDKWVDRIEHSGGLFIGEHSCEVLGDYVAGPSHVMPTGGTARFASPLNVLDFVKITTIVALDPATSRDLSSCAARLAEAESLTAHAAAASQRGARS